MSASRLTNLLLENRGIIGPGEQEKFINPSYDTDLHDPFLLKDMEKATVRIFEAIEAKERIVIYADYDCDGIPGAVVLNDLFKKIGFENFEVYIPDRNEEGYGLNHKAIENFLKSETKLLITVDLGTTDNEEIANAEANGLNVIVTDHHLPKMRINANQNANKPSSAESFGRAQRESIFDLPPAYAVINPKLGEYPEKMLCGSGVAFKLVQAFLKKYGEYFKVPAGFEKWLLDMVGLATLSDQVPLLGENRVLAYYGLAVLRKNRRLGLQKMFRQMRIDPRTMTEDDITFMLTPRLNAASRMASPHLSFQLLSTDNEIEADELAQTLTRINDERKILVANIFREVKKTLEMRETRPVIVIGSPLWRIGILGLVASKLVEEYECPCFVWGREGGEIIKGSCRSDGSVNLVELMQELESETLLDFGGHEMAGGFSVAQDQVYFLEDKLLNAYKKLVLADQSRLRTDQPRFKADAKLNLSDVNFENYEAINKLAPFGVGNPKPIFLIEGVNVSGIKKFGKSGEHLEILLEDEDGKKVKAIQFFKDENSFTAPLVVGEKINPVRGREGPQRASASNGINLLAHFELSHFAGRRELRLRIVDII